MENAQKYVLVNKTLGQTPPGSPPARRRVLRYPPLPDGEAPIAPPPAPTMETPVNQSGVEFNKRLANMQESLMHQRKKVKTDQEVLDQIAALKSEQPKSPVDDKTAALERQLDKEAQELRMEQIKALVPKAVVQRQMQVDPMLMQKP